LKLSHFPISVRRELEDRVFGLEGCHAVVTGGGSGIGAVTARALRSRGAMVSIIGRRAEPLQQAVAAGLADQFVTADVTDEAALQAALVQLIAAQGPVDVLVNNAGAAFSAPFLKTTATDFRTMLDLNLMGAVHTTQAILPSMVERGRGRIVNIASTASLKGYAYVAAYVAAKHALLGLTRALALETARTGVTVNAVCPGFTDTDLLAGSVQTITDKTGRTAEQARADLARANPQGRLIMPDEVAEAVVFLCGPGAASITGTALPVAGGEIG
jgi:3-hydroxybutyrate dehydrogenase